MAKGGGKKRRGWKNNNASAYQRQSPMPTHAVPEDADPRAVDLIEVGEDRLRQLGGDVAVHVVALGPRLPGRVHVEAGTGAEVVGIVFALDVEAAWGAHEGDQRGSVMQDGVRDGGFVGE